MKIKIGNHFVGNGKPTFAIAEASANHNRDFDIAKELIDVVLDAKADAVKFQAYSAETLYIYQEDSYFIN